MQVAQDGTTALQDAFSAVRDDVQQVADEARDQFTPQVGDVEAAVRGVGDALTSLAGGPSAAGVTAVRSAVATLTDDVGVLLDDVGSTC